MKSIHEILIMIRLNVIEQVNKHSKKNTMYDDGLCIIADKLRAIGTITSQEYYLFIQYLYKNRPRNEYTRRMNKTKMLFYGFWKLKNTTYRLKWLDKHVKLTKF